MGTFIRVLLALTLTTFVTAWGFMVGVGVVHGLWIAALPTIGFGAAFALISVVASLVLLVGAGIFLINLCI